MSPFIWQKEIFMSRTTNLCACRNLKIMFYGSIRLFVPLKRSWYRTVLIFRILTTTSIHESWEARFVMQVAPYLLVSDSNTNLLSDSNKAAQEAWDWIPIGMEIYIPSRIFQQTWLTPDCAASIHHRYYHQAPFSRWDKTVENLMYFKPTVLVRNAQELFSWLRIIIPNTRENSLTIRNSEQKTLPEDYKLCSKEKQIPILDSKLAAAQRDGLLRRKSPDSEQVSSVP